MAIYATPVELAGFLQQDLDTYSATQALTLASSTFSAAADSWYAATAVTFTTWGTSSTRIQLPYKNVTAVSAVRLGGNVLTGVTLVKGAIYRLAGFGDSSTYPPLLLEVDLTHGLTTVPDQVKLAVLEIAAGGYQHPDPLLSSESIDDYTVRYNGVPITPGRPWREVAAEIRGTFAA